MTKKILMVVLVAIMTFGATAKKSYDMNTYLVMRGVEAIYSDEYEKALDSFNAELEVHPDNSTALIWRGSLYTDLYDYASALKDFGDAIKLLSKSKKEKELLAYCYSQRGDIYNELEDYDNAIADYTKQLQLMPNDDEAYTNRAIAYFSADNSELALEDCNKAIEINPGNILAYTYKALINMASDDIDGAIEAADYAIKINPYDTAFVKAVRAKCYMLNGDCANAVQDAIDVIESEDEMALDILDIDEIANACYDNLNSKLARASLSDPMNALYPYYQGIMAEKHNKYEDAYKYYLQAYNRSEDHDMLMELARMSSLLQNENTAIYYINKALEESEYEFDEMTCLLQRYMYYMDAEEYDLALQDINTVIEAYPDLDLYQMRGLVYEWQGDYDKAIDDYSLAIVLDPEDEWSHLLRGNLYLLQGEDKLADADFNALIDMPSASIIYQLMAYAKLGDKESAKELAEVYEDEINEDKYNAACLYAILGENEKALELLREALDTYDVKIVQVKRDRDWDSMRNLPEFKALVDEYSKKIGEKSKKYDIHEIEDEVVMITGSVPFTKEGGVTKVKCEINGLPLYFIFDTGASDVSISNVEAAFMLKNGYLKPQDIGSVQYYSTADGDISAGTIINLKKVTFGDFTLQNVRATVVDNQVAPLLLGQSVLQRLGKIEIDNKAKTLNITSVKE